MCVCVCVCVFVYNLFMGVKYFNVRKSNFSIVCFSNIIIHFYIFKFVINL